MQKALFDYVAGYWANGSIEGYYLHHPIDINLWTGIMVPIGNIKQDRYIIAVSARFNEVFNLQELRHGVIVNNSLEEAKAALGNILNDNSFKIISKDMEVYL